MSQWTRRRTSPVHHLVHEVHYHRFLRFANHIISNHGSSMKRICLSALVRQRYTYQQCAHTRAQCHNSALLTLQVIRKITSVAVLCEKDTNNCHENAGWNNIKHMLMKRYSVSRIWNLSASSGNDNTFLRSCEKAAWRNATPRGGERKRTPSEAAAVALEDARSSRHRVASDETQYNCDFRWLYICCSLTVWRQWATEICSV